jgi:hypothetical protein
MKIKYLSILRKGTVGGWEQKRKVLSLKSKMLVILSNDCDWRMGWPLAP